MKIPVFHDCFRPQGQLVDKKNRDHGLTLKTLTFDSQPIVDDSVNGQRRNCNARSAVKW